MSSGASRQQRFPTTDWELFRSLQAVDVTTKQNIVNELLRRYWPAIRHYLLTAKRMRPDDAEEVRSAFTADRLVQDSKFFDRADADRGKFRTLLIRSIENYLIDRRRRSRPIAQLTESNPPPSTVSMVSPSVAFERAWAQSVLAEALKLTEEWLHKRGKPGSWAIFRARIVLPATEGAEPVDFGTLVEQHQLRSAVQASNLLTSARRVFVRKLTASLAKYADDSQSFQSQLDELRKIF